MQSCDLVLTISTLECNIAKGKTADELSLPSAVFSQPGYTLATIADQEAICAPDSSE